MLSSDFANLASEAKFMEQCGADWLHMDIMVKLENSKASSVASTISSAA
jgi:hypothetical protein